jgi:hypothetical protein
MFWNFDYFSPVLVTYLKGSVRTLSNLAAARIRTREVGLTLKILMGNKAHAQFPLKMQKLVAVLPKLAADCRKMELTIPDHKI